MEIDLLCGIEREALIFVHDAVIQFLGTFTDGRQVTIIGTDRR